jgi:ATP-dependent DNA ligase
MVLQPPVEPMLAQARETLPAPGTLPGQLVYQPKWDGYRILVFTPSAAVRAVRLQTRNGALIEGRFPDLVRAAAALPEGWVLDGELIVWSGGVLSFPALQRRAGASARTAAALAEQLPAHLVAFDVLQADGAELLRLPYGQRRQRLEELFAEHALAGPLTLCPETTDRATAQEWLTSWTDVPGIEGLVIRGSEQRYRPGARALIKVRRRATTEAIIGGITGTLRSPRTLMLGRLDAVGTLRVVGRSTPLRPDTARLVAEQLSPAKAGHPWEGVRFTASWGSRALLDVTLVDPVAVAEIAADTAQDSGVWRHPVRVARLRLDLAVSDVPPFGSGAVRR